MRLSTVAGVTILGAIAGAGAQAAAGDHALKLWYLQPAREWTQALPIGNGRLAAMIFGDPRREHLQLNEDTVWSGEKRDRSNPAAAGAVPQIRRLLEEGHPAQAQQLADRT